MHQFLQATRTNLCPFELLSCVAVSKKIEKKYRLRFYNTKTQEFNVNLHFLCSSLRLKMKSPLVCECMCLDECMCLGVCFKKDIKRVLVELSDGGAHECLV